MLPHDSFHDSSITFVFFFSQLFQDVFFLTVEELYAFVEGRSVTNDLRGLVDLRRKEYDGYRKGMPPPERLIPPELVVCTSCTLRFSMIWTF